jgi:hypothetical protein
VRSSGARLCIGMYYCVVHSNEGRYTCKACTRVCIWYVGMRICMGVYDLGVGCVNGIAHRDLRTCAVSLFSHTHVRTALGTTP